MIATLDLADGLCALELLAFQRRAYQSEADLLGYPALPPLHETLPELMDCCERILAWREDGELLGIIGYFETPTHIDITRLATSPARRRQGIARKLLQHLIDLHRGRTLTASTGMANAPAIGLYAQLGFTPTHESHTPDGLTLLHLQRNGAS